MEYLKCLGGERGTPPKFVEVVLRDYLPDSSSWLRCDCQIHGTVLVHFVGGTPPLLTIGSTLSIWDFGMESLHGNMVYVIDLTGDARWVVRRRSTGPITPSFAELCCGLGGWTCGMEVMNKSFSHGGHVLMVDINEDVAKSAAKTWDMPCMTLDEAYGLVLDGCVLCNMVIIGDVQDKRIWTIISLLGIQTILTSPPCPPWSNAARRGGFASKDGLIFPSLVQMADHVGIRLIVVENVASIMLHQHFGALQKFVNDCGFSLVHGTSIDSYPFLPIKRNRWIAAFVTRDLIPSQEIMDFVDECKFPKMSLGPASMGARDCLHISLQDYEKTELQPSALAMAKMCCNDFLPRSFEGTPKLNVLQSRIKSPNDPLQSAMASYGSQHELDDALLRDKGLFTTLISGERDHSQPRYYSPFEFLASMAWPSKATLPADIKQAWKASGNSITIPHVILALFKSHAVLGKNSPWGSKIFSLKDLMSLVFSERISLTHFRQVLDDFRRLESCTDLTTQRGVEHARISHTIQLPSSSPVVCPSVVESVSVDVKPDQHVEPSRGIDDECFSGDNERPSTPKKEDLKHLGHDPVLSGVCPRVVKSRKVMCKDPLWNAANEYVAVSPGIEIAESILDSAKIIPRLTSDPSKSLQAAFDSVSDFRGDSALKGKRMCHDEETWGLDSQNCVESFSDSKHVERSAFDRETWLTGMDKLVFETGVARIWPMTRIVLLVNEANQWNVLEPIEYHLSVMNMIKKVLPHAMSKHFHMVKVDDHQVCPGSIPSGFGKIVLTFRPVKSMIVVSLPDGTSKAIECDVTTTCEELIHRIHEHVMLHPSSFRIICDGLPISKKTFVLEHSAGQWKVAQSIFVHLPADVPTVYSPIDLTFPPKHSDVFVHASLCSIRLAARHPVWSTVRTVSVSMDATIRDGLSMLFPDLTFKCSVSIATLGQYIPENLTFRSLNHQVRYEISFHSTKGFPVTDLEIIEKVSFPDQMKIGDPLVQVQPTVKRWIKSPFQSKSYEKHFHENDTLVRIAGSYFAHTESTQALLVLVDGKCADPRALIKNIPEISMIAVRACPLLGGGKNADIRKMLQEQLTSRGVADDDVSARIDAIISKIQPDKLRMHIAESGMKQWLSIKHLANEAKIRLITVDELKKFQRIKKVDRAESQSTASTTATKGSAPSQKKTVDVSEIKVDLSYFSANGKTVTPLAAEQFGPDAVGVAVMHVDKAERYLPPSNLSSDHLAIVAVGGKDIGDCKCRMIPATNSRGEPVLVSACLVNFGDEKVTFQNGVVSTTLEGQDAMVIEFTIHRRETEDWNLVKSPLLYLGQNFMEITRRPRFFHHGLCGFSPIQRNQQIIQKPIMFMDSSVF